METKITITDTITKEIIVDDLIAHNIKLLNEKGYVTEFSCSGHPSELFVYELNEYNPELTLYHMGSYVAFDEDSAKVIEKIDLSSDSWIYNPDYNAIYGYITKEELNRIGVEKCVVMLMNELKNIIRKLPNRLENSNKVIIAHCEPNLNEFDNLIQACENGIRIYRTKYHNDPIYLGQSFEEIQLINIFNKVRNYAILHDKDSHFQSKNDEFIIESFLVIANGKLLKLARCKDQYCSFNLAKCTEFEYKSIIDLNDII